MDAYGTVPPWSAWLEDEVGKKRARLAQALTQEELEDKLKRAEHRPRLERIVGIYEGFHRRATWGQEALIGRAPARSKGAPPP
jgi:hypothetical protein